jgi:hypothetical protein
MDSPSQSLGKAFSRRAFAKGLGVAGVGIAAANLISCGAVSTKAVAQGTSTTDTVAQIFTAALIAEDLATTMYYNALVGGVIQDSNLAGPGGTATLITTGSAANVGYLRGALAEEIAHANLLRSLLGGSAASGDPVQTFYFPSGTFDNLNNFFPILIALETAFIAAYMTAAQELGLMAANIAPYSSAQVDASGNPLSPTQLIGYAKVAASILGVEAEHRVLARAIPAGPIGGVAVIPADNLIYESTDGLTTVYNGSKSAAAALAPFLSAGSNTASFSLATSLSGSAAVVLPVSGNPPL